MGLLVECPTCKKRNSLKNKTCSCGFVLSEFPGRVYWIDYMINGRRHRERIGPNKAAAMQRLLEVKRAIARAADAGLGVIAMKTMGGNVGGAYHDPIA